MDPIVKYPDFTQLDALSTPLREYARLKCEQGAETGAAALIGQLTETMRCTVRLLQELPDDAALSACEPNELDAIRALRAPAQRRLWEALPPEDIWMDKLEGALLGRIIGCLLGVPVEGLSVESMRALPAGFLLGRSAKSGALELLRPSARRIPEMRAPVRSGR